MAIWRMLSQYYYHRLNMEVDIQSSMSRDVQLFSLPEQPPPSRIPASPHYWSAKKDDISLYPHVTLCSF